jgi:hypothetical protein
VNKIHPTLIFHRSKIFAEKYLTQVYEGQDDDDDDDLATHSFC